MYLLEDIRVLDLSHTLAGPFATMVLADLGANVIKVEPPSGDETRSWAPFVDGESTYFMSTNRGKKSIIVDLKKEEGREIVYRLASRSHIVIENYRPGVRERLGVDPDSLFKVNDQLVYVSIKGFRSGSRYEKKPAYDIIIQAMSGLMATTGEEEGPPIRVSFALFDIITGLLAAIYAIAGLYANRKPVYNEIYLYDAAIFAMSYVPLMYLLTGRKPKRMGSGHPSIVPYQAFQAGDGKWFILAAANDRHWQKFCEAISRKDLLEDPRFKTNPNRVKYRRELVSILERMFKDKPREYWIKLLEEAGVPVAPVYELDEVFEDTYSNEIIIELPHLKLGRVKQIIEPGRINGEKVFSKLAPPLPGQHTIEVLKELGYSDSEIEELERKGVIRTYKGE